jgi:hypothetical protein
MQNFWRKSRWFQIIFWLAVGVAVLLLGGGDLGKLVDTFRSLRDGLQGTQGF